MSRLFRTLLAGLCVAGSVSLASAAGLDSISSSDAAAGLKEALQKGAEYAVGSLGVQNGFLNNKKVHIPLPDSLKTVDKAMRMFGMKGEADALETAMNHAAEQAVAEAKPILMDAIHKLTVKDAKDILSGGEDSVTQYFRRTTEEALTGKFLPIVKQATAKVNLAAQYNAYAGKAAQFGLVDKKDANLDRYVTEKALDGLYRIIGEQEKALRENPMGASSDLLKKVFGAL